jgi:hypothetical protein
MAAADFFGMTRKSRYIIEMKGKKEENQTSTKLDKITMHTPFRKEEDAETK